MNWYIYGMGGNGTVYMRRPCLVEGNKPMDWLPAPADLVTYSNESLVFFQ
jgi:hypothetical protein